MTRNYYKAVIILYITQLALIVLLINNSFMKRYNVLQPNNDDILELIFGIVTFFLIIAAIFLIRKLYTSGLEEEQHRLMRLKFEHIQEQNRLYRRHRHDIKNHLSVISNLAKEKEYEKLEGYLSQYVKSLDDSMISIETGLKELDVLLFSKVTEARQKNISVDFKCSTMIKSDKRYVLDLVSILGNALDNGIEACETMPEQSQGVITVQIGDDPLDYIIEITNTFTQSQIFTSEMLFSAGFSTRKSKHTGDGLAIIKRLTEKLDGEMLLDIQDSLFRLKIEIPKHRLEA